MNFSPFFFTSPLTFPRTCNASFIYSPSSYCGGRVWYQASPHGICGRKITTTPAFTPPRILRSPTLFHQCSTLILHLVQTPYNLGDWRRYGKHFSPSIALWNTFNPGYNFQVNTHFRNREICSWYLKILSSEIATSFPEFYHVGRIVHLSHVGCYSEIIKTLHFAHRVYYVSMILRINNDYFLIHLRILLAEIQSSVRHKLHFKLQS